MTRYMSWLGMIGTLLIVVALSTVMLQEPARQAAAAETIRAAAIVEGMDLYASNCVACHGAAGEGLVAYPPLNSAGVQGMETEDLFRVIERGRYNTAMAGYGVDEGGILTQAQISSLVTVIETGAWDVVAVRVAELGLTPPEIAVVEVSEDVLAQAESLPAGGALVSGLTLYAANCAACHGPNGESTALAPALNTDELRTRLTDADLTRIIQQGVPGTLMAAWDRALTAQQTADLVTLIHRWDELNAAGVVLPAVEAPPIDRSPEAVAAGQRLYSLLCSQCHGIDGFGTPLAPALNNQTFLSQTPDNAIQQIIARGVSGTSMPAWSGYLTEADIAALTAWLRSLEATAPTMALPVPR